MESNHFSYFRVKNFKRFKDLEVKDIGQFNLVLGDNNVGKTSLLEALMFDGDIDIFILSLSKRLEKRMIGGELTGGVWEFFINNDIKVSTSENVVFTDFEFDHGTGSKLHPHFQYKFNKVTKKLIDAKGGYSIGKTLEGITNVSNEINNPKGYSGPADYFEPFISNLDRHNYDLSKQYSKLINDSPKKLGVEFIQSLKVIDPSISDLRDDTLSTDRHLISIESDKFEGRTLLAMYGDGTISVFRVLLLIHLLKGKKLMLDEIDAGIYHKRMKEYWKVILQSAHDNQVQLFATTHNLECIKAYQEALEELGEAFQEKARTIRLVDHEQAQDIRAFTNSYEKMVEELAIGNEVR